MRKLILFTSELRERERAERGRDAQLSEPILRDALAGSRRLCILAEPAKLGVQAGSPDASGRPFAEREPGKFKESSF